MPLIPERDKAKLLAAVRELFPDGDVVLTGPVGGLVSVGVTLGVEVDLREVSGNSDTELADLVAARFGVLG